MRRTLTLHIRYSHVTRVTGALWADISADSSAGLWGLSVLLPSAEEPLLSRVDDDDKLTVLESSLRVTAARAKPPRGEDPSWSTRAEAWRSVLSRSSSDARSREITRDHASYPGSREITRDHPRSPEIGWPQMGGHAVCGRGCGCSATVRNGWVGRGGR